MNELFPFKFEFNYDINIGKDILEGWSMAMNALMDRNREAIPTEHQMAEQAQLMWIMDCFRQHFTDTLIDQTVKSRQEMDQFRNSIRNMVDRKEDRQ